MVESNEEARDVVLLGLQFYILYMSSVKEALPPLVILDVTSVQW